LSRQWDFFLAHAGEDSGPATELYEYLSHDARVFLDSHCLLLGDDWDRELPRAQKMSLITVVLISSRSGHAYYQRDEIAFAIDMARQDPTKHRVVPVFLDRASARRDEIPYGMRLKHGLFVEDVAGLEEVAKRLLALLKTVRESSSSATPTEAEPGLGVSGTVAGFVGPTERGPVEPVLVTRWSEYQEIFGVPLDAEVSFLAHSVRGFFENGGGRAYIVRVVAKDATSASTPPAAIGDGAVLRVQARSAGSWANRLSIRVQNGTRTGLRIMIVKDPGIRSSAGASGQILEDYDNLGLAPEGPNFLLRVLNEGSRYVSCCSTEEPVVARLKNGSAPLVGGSDGTPLDASDYIGDSSLPPAERKGLSELERHDEVSLLCVPDHVHPSLSQADRAKIANEMVDQCERLGDRFAILSVSKGEQDVSGIRPTHDTTLAALYYPWIRVEDPSSQQKILIPPVGHIAGIFARSDTQRGVHRAPVDQEVRGLSREEGKGFVEFELVPDQLDISERLSVNAIRDLGLDLGVRVVSALTMSIDAQWRSISARRFLAFVRESVVCGIRWVRFESNDQRLWSRVTKEVEAFLTKVWQSGALSGQTVEEAFYVRCDENTITQNDIDNGRVVCLIGLSLLEPPFSITLRITAQTAIPQESGPL
jgi:hypothetical protein